MTKKARKIPLEEDDLSPYNVKELEGELEEDEIEGWEEGFMRGWAEA